MKQYKWYWRFLLRSMVNRGFRVMVALASLAAASTLTTAMVGISIGTGERVGEELRAFGANIVVLPESSNLEAGFGKIPIGTAEQARYLDRKAVESSLEEIGERIESRSYILEGFVEYGGMKPAVKGFEYGDLKKLSSVWNVGGEAPRNGGEVLAGKSLAEVLGVEMGDTVEIAGREMKVTGVAETGGSEDHGFITGIDAAAGLLGKPDAVSRVLLNVSREAGSLESTAEILRSAPAGGRVKIVKQIAYAEKAFLGKIEFLLGLVTVAVLLAAFISVIGTMSAMALERKKDVALFKALGGSPGTVTGFFFGESLLTGFLGGLSGFALGAVLAEIISLGAFGKTVPVSPLLLPIGTLTGIAVSLVSSLPALRVVARVDPISVLRKV